MVAYLDHAATTALRPESRDIFLANANHLGNPSSVHSSGQAARRVLEDAREKLAAAVGCHRSEVIFTGGGTESNNLAIKGLFAARIGADPARNIIITAAAEHHAGIEPVEHLESAAGAETIWLNLNRQGELDLDQLAEVLQQRHQQVALISLMWANNETGVIWPITEISKLAKQYDIPVHSDAVAAFGHMELSFADSGLATMSISGHKVGAPVGIGALIVARSAKLAVISHGGGQERGIRSGTLSAPLAAAFAEAAALAVANLATDNARLAELADRVIAAVVRIAPDAEYSRGSAAGLPGTVHFLFSGCSGDSLLFLLDASGVSVSTGSACRAGVAQASHVLVAMGRTVAEASGSLRISLGYSTTEQDIEAFIQAFPAAYAGAKQAGLPSK